LTVTTSNDLCLGKHLYLNGQQTQSPHKKLESINNATYYAAFTHPWKHTHTKYYLYLRKGTLLPFASLLKPILGDSNTRVTIHTMHSAI